MEQAQEAVETAEQSGVNEVPTHEGHEETSPVSEENTEQAEVEAEASGDEEEVVPFHKHPRWQKREKKLKQYERQLKELNDRFESNEVKGALGLANMLKQNPTAAQVLYGILNGQSPEQALSNVKEAMKEPEDPYAQYDEATANKLREIDELKQWKQSQEQREEQQYQQAVEQYQNDLNREFDKRLMADGYLNEDGTADNEQLADLMGNATLSFLQQNAKNPLTPTPQEFDQAYNTVKDTMKCLETQISKKALDKAVSNVPRVPKTGSKSGSMPEQKTSMSEMDRIMDIAGAL